MTCLLKKMELAARGDEPRYTAMAWGDSGGEQPAIAEVDYIDECGDGTMVVDPRLCDCKRCLWFYERFIEAEQKKALQNSDAARWGPYAIPVKKEKP